MGDISLQSMEPGKYQHLNSKIMMISSLIDVKLYGVTLGGPWVEMVNGQFDTFVL